MRHRAEFRGESRTVAEIWRFGAFRRLFHATNTFSVSGQLSCKRLLASLHKTGRFHLPLDHIWSFGPCQILRFFLCMALRSERYSQSSSLLAAATAGDHNNWNGIVPKCCEIEHQCHSGGPANNESVWRYYLCIDNLWLIMTMTIC